MLERSISIYLPSNAFVELDQAPVWHMFDAHGSTLTRLGALFSVGSIDPKSRDTFLREFILAYIAPGERFSFRAIDPAFTPVAISSRSCCSSARVQGLPAGFGPAILRKSANLRADPIAITALFQAILVSKTAFLSPHHRRRGGFFVFHVYPVNAQRMTSMRLVVLITDLILKN